MPQVKRPYVILALASLLGFVVSAALAQGNMLIIEQRGSDNTLTVDQAAASNSTVGGLSLLPPPLAPLLPIVAPRGAARTALQVGSGNSADLDITGDAADVVLLQNSGVGAGNDATVTVNGNNLASVIQSGAANSATVNITGELSSGAVTQMGDRNVGGVSVLGQRTNGLVTQFGSDNSTSLTVIGNDVNATYTQLGSGLRSAEAGSLPANAQVNPESGGVVVQTNAQNVSITQTAFGTGN